MNSFVFCCIFLMWCGGSQEIPFTRLSRNQRNKNVKMENLNELCEDDLRNKEEDFIQRYTSANYNKWNFLHMNQTNDDQDWRTQLCVTTYLIPSTLLGEITRPTCIYDLYDLYNETVQSFKVTFDYNPYQSPLRADLIICDCEGTNQRHFIAQYNKYDYFVLVEDTKRPFLKIKNYVSFKPGEINFPHDYSA